MLIFSTWKGRERRTYVYDKAEKYGDEYVYKFYYLLTAYKLEGKDAKRNKIERLYEKRHTELL